MHLWPHAPVHFADAKGAYVVTAGTYGKLHHFREQPRLEFLHNKLLTLADAYGWQLQAWAVFSGLVQRAANYPWCSAGWFELRAAPAFFTTVSAFKTDRINVRDDFAVEWDGAVAPAVEA